MIQSARYLADNPDWLALQRHWDAVLSSSRILGSRSHGWHVRREFSGHGITPIAGDPDEIAIYYESREVGRWPLSLFEDGEADG